MTAPVLTDTALTDLRARRRFCLVCCALVVTLLLVGAASLEFGAAGLELWRADSDTAGIVAGLRLSRFLTGVGVGCGLAVSGTVLQAVLRNPLAEPGVVGLNAGAALAAASLLIIATGPVSSASLVMAALAGAVAAVSLVMILAWSPRNPEPSRLILSGIAVAALAGALLTALTLVGPPHRLQRLLTWLSGSLHAASWADVRLLWIGLAAMLPTALLASRRLDLLGLDPKSAAGLGERGRLTLVGLLLLAATLAGFATAVAGIIVFVGLIAPFLARSLVGVQSGMVLSVSGLIGAVLVSGADLAGRLLLPPTQFPAGLICALLGAPFFFWLMRRTHA